jgi:choline dehydrogenase-like flavoprotein
MTIRTLGADGERTTTLRADVCVVGAGIAGLVAATRLARDGTRRVVVLESGVRHDDPRMVALDCIENPSRRYEGAARSRGLGGTSVKWAGKLLPLTPDDTRDRPWLGTAGWPFDIAELDRYTAEIEAMMGVDGASYEEDAAALLDPHGLLPRGDADFALRWPKRPSPANHDIAHVLRRELRGSANLEVWLGATATGFRFDAGDGSVTAVEAVDHGGRRLVVHAAQTLVAAGSHESTRLLLLADRQSGGAISRETDALGRHFNDHLGLHVAVLRPIDAVRTNTALADRWPLGADRHLHFELRPSVQRELGIASTYFDFGLEVPPQSALAQARRALQAGRKRQWGRAVRAALGAVPDSASLVRTAHWSLRARQKFWPGDGVVAMKVWVEQLPHWQNRIGLSEQIDALGQPLLNYEVHRTEHEERAFRVTVERIRDFWGRHLAPICALEWTVADRLGDTSLAEAAVELSHPAGATRMGRSAADSVVDPSLRVHRIPNLSVASASVFPTSGSANPTFTIMQLAMRAADAIASRLAPR